MAHIANQINSPAHTADADAGHLQEMVDDVSLGEDLGEEDPLTLDPSKPFLLLPSPTILLIPNSYSPRSLPSPQPQRDLLSRELASQHLQAQLRRRSSALAFTSPFLAERWTAAAFVDDTFS